MCVANGAELGCWSGGGERWGAAWWDDEQHLSPINSPYLSPVLLHSRNLSPLPRHMVASSFAVWALFHENSLSPASSPFHFFSGRGGASAGATILKKLLLLWRDSPPCAGWAVSLFPILLFWVGFRIAPSSIFLSLLVNEWTSLAVVLWFGEIKEERKRKGSSKKKTCCLKNNSLVFWAFRSVPLSPPRASL